MHCCKLYHLLSVLSLLFHFQSSPLGWLFPNHPFGLDYLDFLSHFVRTIFSRALLAGDYYSALAVVNCPSCSVKKRTYK